MTRPTDEKLYAKVKAKVYREIPKHSAYRSGQLVQRYKEEFKKLYPNKQPYTGKKTSKGLTRWFKEKWRTQSGDKTYKRKSDVFRPTKRISKDTPKTFGEISKPSLKKAQKEKARTGRVKKF
tara:strand:- start:335 stop:700 length:366 start_codon:yes stop_codon:yes gene_type:complete